MGFSLKLTSMAGEPAPAGIVSISQLSIPSLSIITVSINTRIKFVFSYTCNFT